MQQKYKLGRPLSYELTSYTRNVKSRVGAWGPLWLTVTWKFYMGYYTQSYYTQNT